jgi:methylated-DNA-[protein]-cysteine S-methyltransferase
MNLYADIVPTPLPELAALLATVDAEGHLVALDFLNSPAEAADRKAAERRVTERGDQLTWDAARCKAVARELTEYFAGTRRNFEVTLAPRGTAFQKRVWEELARIPYGATISYAELAQRVDRPGAARAVGRANGTNPIPVILPCHRVIGADGALTGYGGGVPLKRALLALEGAWIG